MQCKWKMSEKAPGLGDRDYQRLAQQHQALLAIRGNAAPPASVGYLAGRLRIRPNTAAELAQRLEQAGLITRSANESDRRSMDLVLTAEGGRRLEALSLAHRRELSELKPVVMALLETLDGENG